MKHSLLHLDLPTVESYAQGLAQELSSQERFVVLLQGTLGAGKTTFATAFARALLGDEISLQSPTYTYVREYPLSLLPAKQLVHMDFYRLESKEAVESQGIMDLLHASTGIFLVEWPEIVEEQLKAIFKGTWLSIHLHIEEPDMRNLEIETSSHMPFFSSQGSALA